MSTVNEITPSQALIRGQFRLLVFDVGNRKMATPVEMVRTIADYDDSVFTASGVDEGSGVRLNFVDVLRQFFPDEAGNEVSERKIIVLKSNEPVVNGIIVDRVHGVGTFQELYPVPAGIFKIPDGIITHLVISEEPWTEVVNLQKIAEINRS